MTDNPRANAYIVQRGECATSELQISYPVALGSFERFLFSIKCSQTIAIKWSLLQNNYKQRKKTRAAPATTGNEEFQFP